MECSVGLCSYYDILGVNLFSSDEEIRRAYRKRAMQWHPDKWTRSPAFVSQAKQKFQQIQEAYSVLSDTRKRRLYDAEVFEEDEVEGFTDFLQEMKSLINDARKEEKRYNIEELQRMLWEMAEEQSRQCFGGSFSLYESTSMTTTTSSQSNMIGGTEHLSNSVFQTHSFFR